ncbi:MAG: family 78 glycoside hydrolase catalytic domain, partial [Lachnospiraceae bacterium]|nr:family 78 glycoside hydrolase catalytic domain [Lachnospiraceae bacterium]
MKITCCQTGHLYQPLGFSLQKPVFTWLAEESAGKYITESRVLVSLHPDMSEPFLDTGWSEKISYLGYAPKFEQKPRTRYFWQVMSRTDADEEACSGINWFETAKLEEPWAAQWITCDSSEKRHPVFSKDLPITKEVASARLYICGIGMYKAYLNGKPVVDEYLTPYSNNYRKWLQYQTYDVTEELNRGGKLKVALGNGWFLGRYGWQDSVKGCYGDDWMLIAEVRVIYADGTEAVYGTDDTWQVTRSRFVFSNIYDGEILDDTLPPVAPVPATLLKELPAGELTARYSPRVIIHTELKPKLLYTPAGETVFDLGQNMAGGFRYKVCLPKGETLKLTFGEQLQKGCFYRDNLRSAKAEYIYVSDGRPHVLENQFTFYGGRYVKVEGIKNPDPEDFRGLCYTTQMDRTGYLETGHPLVQQLLSNVEWSRLDNFIDVPTDCPQRDERLGWTGDAQVFAPTASFFMDTRAFYRKYLWDMRNDQVLRGGAVANYLPNIHGEPGGSAVWADAATFIPDTVYEAFGDKALLTEHYP